MGRVVVGRGVVIAQVRELLVVPVVMAGRR